MKELNKMKKKLIIFDMDGTIYLGKNLIDGALETFDYLNKKPPIKRGFFKKLGVIYSNAIISIMHITISTAELSQKSLLIISIFSLTE